MTLRVGGLTRLTTIDSPAAWRPWCSTRLPWRCGYCHNPELLDASAGGAIAWESVLCLLTAAAACSTAWFSGGEPLAQSACPKLWPRCAMGFATALHTGGMYPDRLAAVLPPLDWVGLDIRAHRPADDAITRRRAAARAWQSLQLLLASGVDSRMPHHLA